MFKRFFAAGAVPFRQLVVAVMLVPFVFAYAHARAGDAPAAVAHEQVTPAIAGVVNAGTPIELVKDGFEAVEGPLPLPDGGLIFTNNRAARIVQIAADGAVSSWYEGAGGANALTRTPNGEVVATLTENRAIGVVQPGQAPRVLVGDYEGTPFNRPNDLVASRRGDIYFTDTVPLTAATAPAMPSAVYVLSAEGKLVRIAADIARPNGVALSPDDRTLYVANTSGEWVYAFELDGKGQAGKRREFAKLAMSMPTQPQPAQTQSPQSQSQSQTPTPTPQTPTPTPQTPTPQTPTQPPPGNMGGAGADGLAIDEKGRLYVATTIGVQVFSPEGAPLGTITLPKQPQNLAFAGPNRGALFVVGRGAVYRIATLTRGPNRAGK